MSIILASASPRRKELLNMLGVQDLKIVPAKGEEKAAEGLAPDALVITLASHKAREVALRSGPGDIVVAADTVVWSPEVGVLGKPADELDALRMLTLLSGRTHFVTSGVSILLLEGSSVVEHTFHETTDVTFHPLSDAWLRANVASGEPLDKAGAYAIQCRGAVLVKSIRGDYDNVVGLPLSRLVRELNVVCSGHDFVLDVLGG